MKLLTNKKCQNLHHSSNKKCSLEKKINDKKIFSVNLPCDAPDLILQSAMPEQKNDLFKDIGNNYF